MIMEFTTGPSTSRLAACAAALLLCACSGVRVIVQDPEGRPVAGANVTRWTPSIGGPGGPPVAVTGARGDAYVPWTAQRPWFVQASREGYCPEEYQVEVTGKPQPVVVVLRPRQPGAQEPCWSWDVPAGVDGRETW